MKIHTKKGVLLAALLGCLTTAVLANNCYVWKGERCVDPWGSYRVDSDPACGTEGFAASVTDDEVVNYKKDAGADESGRTPVHTKSTNCIYSLTYTNCLEYCKTVRRTNTTEMAYWDKDATTCTGD